jgi:protein involved in polysaccharide export with SLBB domain
VLVIVAAIWCFHTSHATPVPPVTDKTVEPYIYVSGAVVAPGRYGWFKDMTVFDGIRAAGGFTTNFVRGRIHILHVEGTQEFYTHPGTIDDTNKPPVLRKGDHVSVEKRII